MTSDIFMVDLDRLIHSIYALLGNLWENSEWGELWY